MLHPLFIAEGLGWELSPPELREGSKAWPLALCQVGGLHLSLCPASLALCAEGAVGRLHTQACAKLCPVSAGQQLQGRAVPRVPITSAGAASWM